MKPQAQKGPQREKSQARDVYFADGYFRFRQLCSYVHQLYDIHRIRPQSILEIGIGNGFTSTFLRKAGYAVTTADINAALEPDLCCNLQDLPSRAAGQPFDLVVCCEVLEHLPEKDLESNLAILRSLGRQLYLTLPAHRPVLGLGWIPHLPRLGRIRALGIFLEIPWKRPLQPMHHWEVGSSPATSRKKILSLLGRFYPVCRSRRYALNPAHIMFHGRLGDSPPGRDGGKAANPQSAQQGIPLEGGPGQARGKL